MNCLIEQKLIMMDLVEQTCMGCNLCHSIYAQLAFTTCLLFVHNMSNMYAQYSDPLCTVLSIYAQEPFTTYMGTSTTHNTKLKLTTCLFIHNMSSMYAQYSDRSSLHSILWGCTDLSTKFYGALSMPKLPDIHFTIMRHIISMKCMCPVSF